VRILALRLWLVVVRSEVGDHTGARCTPAVGIRLCLDCGAVHRHGFCNHLFVPIHAAAALPAYGGGSGFVHDAVKAFLQQGRRDTGKPTLSRRCLLRLQSRGALCPCGEKI